MHLLIINQEFPPVGGGAATASYNIAKEAVRAGARVTVLTSSFAGQPAREILDGIDIIRIPAVRRHEEKSNPFEMLTFLLSTLWWIALRGRGGGYDVCIAFFGIPSGPAAWLLRQLAGTPYIVSLRGGDVPGFLPKDLGRWHFFTVGITRFLWRNAEAVVANSEGLRTLARNALSSLDFKLIPNGVDVELFHPATRKEEATGPVRLLFVGRLCPQKNVHGLLDSMKLLPKGKWELHLVGDGPLREELQAHARRFGLTEQVLFHGWVPREKLTRMYREAGIFVFPSMQEGMPNTVLEAMASGLPVVASRIEGCEDIIRDGQNGLLVPAGDIAALANALRRLLDDEKMRDYIGIAGRDTVVSRFGWSKTAQEYISLCETACVKHTKGS